jgi:hypothetical protein
MLTVEHTKPPSNHGFTSKSSPFLFYFKQQVLPTFMGYYQQQLHEILLPFPVITTMGKDHHNMGEENQLRSMPPLAHEWVVDISFVASSRYSHIGLGVGHVGIIVGTHIALCENPLAIELGLGIVVGGASLPRVGASHLLGGINNCNLMLSLEGVPKLTH